MATMPAATVKVMAAVTIHENNERTRSTPSPNLDRVRNATSGVHELTWI